MEVKVTNLERMRYGTRDFKLLFYYVLNVNLTFLVSPFPILTETTRDPVLGNCALSFVSDLHQSVCVLCGQHEVEVQSLLPRQRM